MCIVTYTCSQIHNSLSDGITTIRQIVVFLIACICDYTHTHIQCIIDLTQRGWHTLRLKERITINHSSENQWYLYSELFTVIRISNISLMLSVAVRIRRTSEAVWVLASRVRILLRAWTFVSCVFSVLCR